jgi:transposase
VTNIDETSWRERLGKVWLWAVVTPLFPAFPIAKNRSGGVAKALLGSEDGPVVGSDRFSAYEWIMARWRQVCWAHLRRDFPAMIDRAGDGEDTGRRLGCCRCRTGCSATGIGCATGLGNGACCRRG